MSMKVAPPPAASARLPLAAPSQSVRPGSLKWTWQSRTAGKIVRPRASISSGAPGMPLPISVMAPASTAISTRGSAQTGQEACPTNTVPPRMTRSGIVALQIGKETRAACQRGFDIFYVHGFVGVVADAAGTADEKHRRGELRRENHSVVPRAARHAMRGKAFRGGSTPQSCGEVCVHRDCALIEAELGAESQTATLGDGFGRFQDALYAALADFIRYVTHVQAGMRGARDHVAGAGFHCDAPHGGHKMRNRARDSLHGADPFRRARQSIATQRHRSGAGVIGLAFEVKHQPALPRDAVHNAERHPEMLQHRTLLDMKFQISEDIGRQSGVGNARRVETKIANGAGDEIDQVCVQTAHCGATTDEGNAVAHAFFLGEAD